jgi:uncharacterized iron-regulated protein
VYHQVQLMVLKALHSRGVNLAIAVEWLPATAQPILDRYLAREIDDATFVHQSQWRRRWGHNFKHYAPILHWARQNKVPIWALNAPRGLARAVRIYGKNGIPRKFRKHRPPLNTGNTAHRRFVRRMLEHVQSVHRGHQHLFTEKGFERYYLAQLVWDESMSRNLVKRLKSAAGRDKTAVVFAGLGHVAHGHGVPLRAGKLLGKGFKIVLPVPPGQMGQRSKLLRQQHYPRKRADLLWEPPAAGLQMVRTEK